VNPINPLHHALHNEKACDLLFSDPDAQFNDWVITTAFYSVLHFALYDLFPLEHDRVCHATFSEYHISLPRKISKHAAIIRLVSARSPYARQYRWLFGACMYARYANYRISRSKAEYARSLLDSIKSSLSKPLTR
jgi:hypothetical protein